MGAQCSTRSSNQYQIESNYFSELPKNLQEFNKSVNSSNSLIFDDDHSIQTQFESITITRIINEDNLLLYDDATLSNQISTNHYLNSLIKDHDTTKIKSSNQGYKGRIKNCNKQIQKKIILRQTEIFIDK